MSAQYQSHRSRHDRRRLHLEVLEDRCLPSTYTLTDLGPGIAYGINDAGLVVGGESRAFTWDSTQGRQDLPTLGGDGLSDAFAVSPEGLIVGDATAPVPGSPRHAFLYDHGTVTDLGTFGGELSAARGVNDAGQVVGWADTNDPYDDEHAFLWDSQNGLQDLGTLGGLASDAYGINSSGLVVGFSFLEFGAHAFVWDSMSGMTDIGSGGGRSGAYGVNDLGQVVGSMNGDAFLYDGGTLTDLGTLGHGVAGGMAINDAGVIVGAAYAHDSWDVHGFVYADGAMKDLNLLVSPVPGLTIEAANGINNAGRIVGVALDRFSRFHAILLTPDDGGGAGGMGPSQSGRLAAIPEVARLLSSKEQPFALALPESASGEAVTPLPATDRSRQACGGSALERRTGVGESFTPQMGELEAADAGLGQQPPGEQAVAVNPGLADPLVSAPGYTAL
jgi:probable HAF family extracellular repeat protein